MLSESTRLQFEEFLLASLFQWQPYLEKLNLRNDFFKFPHTKATFERILELKHKYGKVELIHLLNEHLPRPFIEIMAMLEDENAKFAVLPTVLEIAQKLQNDSIGRKTIDWIEGGKGMHGVKELIDESIVASDRLNTFGEDFNDYLAKYDELGKDQRIIKTSWAKFDDLSSMGRGDLVVIGGRTSMGKSAFSLALATEAALSNSKVLFISIEMNKDSLLQRIFASLTNVPSNEYRLGRADLRLVPHIDLLNKNLTLHYAPKLKSTDLFGIANNYDLVVVDYIQLMKDESQKGVTEAIRIGKITSNLKLLAGEKNCVVVAPAQLNRENEKAKRKPNLSDLRDSGCIEQDADIVTLLHAENRESVETELIIAKNRNGGLGSLWFGWIKPVNKWREIAMPIE